MQQTIMDPMTIGFADGCDARLRGLPLEANPYHGNAHEAERKGWAYGWLDVQQHWASRVRGRWPVRPLPPVRGLFRCCGAN